MTRSTVAGTRLFAIAVLALAACVGSEASGDGGPPRSPDSGPERCDGVDRSCPAELPGAGTRCEGALDCPYTWLASCSPPETARCIDGRWSYAGFCLPGPVLHETCSGPDTGPFPGVSVAVTAPTEITWGLQGSAMIDLDLALTPPEDAPRCAQVRVAMTLDGQPTESTVSVRIPCGREVRLLEILPSNPCERRPYPYTIDVEIQGVGTQHLEGELMGGPPMFGPSPCPPADDAGVVDGGA